MPIHSRVPRPSFHSLALAEFVLVQASGCNSRSLANDRRCRELSAEACRADRTCVAIGGPELEPYPEAVARGRRCEPGCASGNLAPESDWAPATTKAGAAPEHVARDGRVCAGPSRCQLNRTNSGDYCFDPDPPCSGCRQVFKRCQSANLCSGVVCP